MTRLNQEQTHRRQQEQQQQLQILFEQDAKKHGAKKKPEMYSDFDIPDKPARAIGD